MGAHSHPLQAARAAVAARRRRVRMETEIEMHLNRVTILLACLDRDDGDPDLEDDDPAGDPLDEHGEAESETGAKLLPVLPRYGIDQTRGPSNERHAVQAWLKMAGDY